MEQMLDEAKCCHEIVTGFARLQIFYEHLLLECIRSLIQLKVNS